MRKIRFFLKLIIGISLLLLLFTKLPMEEILSSLSSISIKWYLFGIALFFPFYFLKYLRWWYLVNEMGMDSSLWRLFIIYFKGVFLGLVTPGRLGEFGRAWFLKGKNNQGYKGLASVLIDRVVDVVLMLFITVLGVFFYKGIIGGGLYKVLLQSAAIFILSMGCIYFVLKHKKLREVFLSMMLRVIPFRMHDKIKIFLKGMKDLTPRILISIFGISVISQLIWAGIGYIFLLSLGIKASYWWLVWCMSAVAIVSNLPFTYLGIGIRESAFAFFFAANNYLPSEGFSFGLLISSVWFWAGLLGFAVWMIDHNFSQVQENA